ncbi:MAG: hypothetical protein QF441_11965 [Bacteriovoracaceae bacterium]|jgi:hypothetical protein|nr:hypothetical protein [Halobacteriovoraceae bacterium]MDP7321321.1 hypothetical protein [Bacteriovoracaceae bacterium]|tara:strand:+ start:192 stop:671 length:480 start_codon:yes stop_codon:yes gene_type:complete
MRLNLLFLIGIMGLINISHAQDLLQERIWKVSSKKRSIFFDKGVFHSEKNPIFQKLNGIRNSYIPARGYERIVFDFSTDRPPKVYGKISEKEQKVYVDFFNTALGTNVEQLKNIKYLKNLNFFTIDKDNISVELQFSQKVSFDIFYLENPGRLVIDVKK